MQVQIIIHAQGELGDFCREKSGEAEDNIAFFEWHECHHTLSDTIIYKVDGEFIAGGFVFIGWHCLWVKTGSHS